MKERKLCISEARFVMFNFFKKSDKGEEEQPQVVRINTHGTATAELEADKAIPSNKKDNDKRRTVKLERTKLSSSWGFTLQSYGIYNTTTKCIENYTFVDYVEMKSPAFLSGMRRSDIIFAVDGQSTENLSHTELVDKVKACKNSMRLVVINSNICQKVELHQRRQKLQALLRQKQSELKGLESRETALHYKVKARLKEKELRRQKIATDNQTHLKPTNLTSVNNNIDNDGASLCSSSDLRDVRPKLSAYMAKLSLSPELGPTPYERTLFQQSSTSNLKPNQSGSLRSLNRTNVTSIRHESRRVGNDASTVS
ncbi:hypothetical protein EB796_021790 [Bugula neritina]|uniref:PDZ domain-containing protein n=1 Tax=Bugula neritina TaxID=10212 RepID=A0A7J7J151_BUGNE|nr:hypothetical protein EB796_021790 [Bugula neritina]